MKYKIKEDIEICLEYLEISHTQLAEELSIDRVSLERIANGEVYPSNSFLESFYSFVLNNKIKKFPLTMLKCSFDMLTYGRNILFHGAKNEIDGPIDLLHSRKNIDVGVGFYLTESYNVASEFVFANKNSSVYVYKFKKSDDLKIIDLSVSLKWMLMVCYYRDILGEYKNSKIVKEIIDEIEKADIVICPIADNNMYDIMNRFANEMITDKQAINALSSSRLGKQWVFRSKKAIKRLKEIDRLYLAKPEREKIEEKRKQYSLESINMSQEELRKYRRDGKYIEELLK